MDFQSLGLCDVILSAVAGQGYATPTPIQARSIPQVLAGKDVLGIAQTGTGKTAAFAIPIIQRLMELPPKHDVQPKRPRALVLSPTRELATQIAQSFRTYGDGSGLSGTTIFGGVGQGGQIKALQRGIDILVATPGRLLDLIGQGYVDLRSIEIFVLDEADRMLDMGFIKPIRQIISEIPKERQSLLFSATMPGEIQGLADSMLRNPVRVEVAPPRSTASTVTQSLAFVPRALKVGTLIKLLGDEAMSRVIVFTKTKHGADKVATKLHNAGFDSEAIHGNRNQNQRQRALNAFKTGRVRVLVATDVAARGLDVDDITHVINLDLPMEPEAYVHRIGRTGRAGASGIAISFCDESERPLLRDIERMLGKKIPLAQLGLTEAEAKDARQMERQFAQDVDNLIDIKPGWSESVQSGRSNRNDAQRHPRSGGTPRADWETQPQRPVQKSQHRFGPRQGSPAQHAPNPEIARDQSRDQGHNPNRDKNHEQHRDYPQRITPAPRRDERPRHEDLRHPARAHEQAPAQAQAPAPAKSPSKAPSQDGFIRRGGAQPVSGDAGERTFTPKPKSGFRPNSHLNARQGGKGGGPNRGPSGGKSKGRFGPPRSR
ncbi:MAG: DEAD/DEAH box helicase [Planctomycetes bacterium]|nr:DEAD/DEAH box helicase [Planctomycetota bacterium]